MFVQLYIAKRYLFGKKSKNIINIVSGISVAVVAIVTISLFVALSVFNGLNNLITSSFNKFDSELKISPKQGKFFKPDSVYEYLCSVQGVMSVSQVVEDDVLLRYKERQFIGRVKGVSDNFNQTTNIENCLVDGEYFFKKGIINFALLGESLSYNLAVGTHYIDPIYIYAPRRKASINVAPDKAYSKKYVYASGVFASNQDIDSRYIIVSLKLAQELLDYTDEINHFELAIKENYDVELVKNEIKNIIGDRFNIEDRYEQHSFLYKIMKSEKWAVFLIISFILIIASFNIIGSLSMLIIDKKADIKVLQSMGASDKTIKQIFLFEGWMISLFGAIIGIIIGFGICWLQMKFGLLKLQGSGNFIVSAYPVKIEYVDVFYTLGMVLLIGFFVAYYPVRYITKKHKLLR